MPFKLNFKRWWLLDALLLAGLAAYILAGVPLAPFHGDEGMQVYATRDYITAFVDQDPNALKTTPPYFIDSRPHLRLINGSVQRYAAGAALHRLGYTLNDLPIEPGWNWGLNYDENVAGSWLPQDPVLMPSRYSSAAFLALSLLPMLGLGLLLGGRRVAYPALILYALHPALLLNGRRAMMEGSLLCFGLLTVWTAAVIARRVNGGVRVPVALWMLLPLFGGLTLASKHSGAVFLVAAWLWIFVAGCLPLWRWGKLARVTGALAVQGVLAIALFIALSPALWNQPFARLQDLVSVRAELLNIQVEVTPNAPTAISSRVGDILWQPFLAPPMFFEVASWGEAADILAQIDTYQRSVWAGLPTSALWLGVPLTGLMLWGGVVLVWRAQQSPVLRVGLGLWWTVSAAMLLANPLPWQRYSLPIVPIAALLVGIAVAHIILHICEQIRTSKGLQAGVR